MIKTRYALFLLVAFLFTIPSCKKEDGRTAIPSSANSTVMLKVDGTLKTATLSVATIFKTANTFQLSAQLGTNEGIVLNIDNPKVGSYDVVTDLLNLGYSTSSSFSGSYLASAGTVTITSYTETAITGTFQFTAANVGGTAPNKAITEGTFNCKYIKY